MNREPNKKYTIPLWQVNHSTERLIMEEQSDYRAFRLGYQMQPTFVDPERAAYPYFSDEQFPDGNVTEMDYMEGVKVALMHDFNRFPQTAALGQKIGDRYLVFDEVVTDNALTSEQGENVAKKLQHWGIKHVYLYGDNTSNQRSGKYGRTGKNDWQYIKEELQKAGITFSSKLRKSNPKRKVRVDKVNGLIYNPSTEERQFLLHSRCKKGIRDYKEAIVDDEGIKIDSGKIGHLSDACDYWMYEVESGNKGLTYVL